MIHRESSSFTAGNSFATPSCVYMGFLCEEYVNCCRLANFSVREASAEDAATAVEFKVAVVET